MSPHVLSVLRPSVRPLPVLQAFLSTVEPGRGRRPSGCATARRLAPLAALLLASVAWPALAAGAAGGATKPTRTGIASLPAPLQGALSARFGVDDPAYRVVAEGARHKTQNDRHGFTATMGADGATIRAGGGEWRLRLTGWGRGESRRTATSCAVTVSANRVEVARGGLTEWWVNGPLGLEQGWTVQAPRRRGGGPLTLSLAQGGTLNAAAGADDRALVVADAAGRAVLRYGGLAAYDATGRELPARFEVTGREIRVRVEDAGASYPVRIDPWLQAAELTASDGGADDDLGRGVAVSADGSTVVAGAPYHQVGGVTRGAAYVFVRPASGWGNATEVAELTASDGSLLDLFGLPVAVNRDGSTVVVGAVMHWVGTIRPGAAFVFVRPLSGWANATQTAELTVSDGESSDNFAMCLAISDDGSTVFAGSKASASTANRGAVYAFVRPRLGWVNATETAELTASDGVAVDGLGRGGVAVSADGSTVAAGSPFRTVGTNTEQGVAYVWVEPAGGWANATQTAELTGPSWRASQFGSAVAVSGDGSTVVVGAPGIGSSTQGAAFVFVKPAGGWADGTPTAALTASDGGAGDYLGLTLVAASRDGSTIVAGAPIHQVGGNVQQGAAYVFVEPAGGWADATETSELTASDGGSGDWFGQFGGLSQDGSNVVVSGEFHQVAGNAKQGEVYVFGPPSGVRGTVTDTTYHLPVVGATVQAGTAWTLTDSDGHYLLRLDAGTYGVTASKPGMVPATATGVAVSANAWTVQDFTLDSAGTAWVDGYVTDAGHGWPLLASVAITTRGTPVATPYTNPFNGYYLISLPTGCTYALTVNAVQPGYVQQVITVDTPGPDQTQNFPLFPDPGCTVPGYTPGAGCTPVAGGLVAGFVTDANTGAPLVGARVANDLGASTLTVTPPSGSGVAAGYYSMFTPIPPFNQPAIRTFTASYPAFPSVQRQLVVNPGWIVQADFPMLAGWLEINPTSLWSRLYPGQDEHQTLTLTNMGGLTAGYRILSIPIATTWPHMSPVSRPSAPAGSLSTGPAPSVSKRTPSKVGSRPFLTGVPAFGMDLSTATYQTWPDVTAPGTVTTIAAEPGTAYFAGAFYMGDFSKEYVIDYYTGNFATLDTTTGAATVLGTATPNPNEAWTGLTATNTGAMYGSATTCSASTLYTIDPGTGTATPIGPVTNAPCLIDISADALGNLYGVDIITNNLVKIDPATGAGTVIGPTGISANFAQGLSFDTVNGVLYWAAYNSDTAQGELRTIDVTTGASTLLGAFPSGHEVDAFAIQSYAGATLPWLIVSPASGSVAAGVAAPIDAHFIADGADRFGLFRATLKTVTQTPYPVNDVSACFSKAFLDVPAGYWADANINAVAAAKITSGCGSGNFCPEDVMTRGVMAPWLLLGRYGSLYSPPPCVGIFADVPCETTPNADYIEDLYNKGITAGCHTDPPMYCPEAAVSRAQMAVFLVKAKEAQGYTPPPCTGLFTDVACPGGFAVNWIEELYRRGITAGCGSDLFCPDASTTRAQEAVFVRKDWNIPMCQ